MMTVVPKRVAIVGAFAVVAVIAVIAVVKI